MKSNGVSLGEIKGALGRFRFKSILLAALPIIFMQLTLQIARLWALIPVPATRLPPLRKWIGVARAFSFGQAVNAFAPARAGDAIKLVVLQRENRDIELPLGTAAGVILADKALDILSLVALSLFCVAAWGKRLKTIHIPHFGEYFFGGIGGLILIIVIALWVFPKVRTKIRELWTQVVKGLAPLRAPGKAIPSLLFSMLGWCGELWAIRILAAAQGWDLSFNEVLWAMIVLNFGVAVPIALANIGAFEASMTLGLVQVGVPAPIGLAIATAHHALQIVCVYLWAGLLALIRPPNPALMKVAEKTAQSL